MPKKIQDNNESSDYDRGLSKGIMIGFVIAFITLIIGQQILTVVSNRPDSVPSYQPPNTLITNISSNLLSFSENRSLAPITVRPATKRRPGDGIITSKVSSTDSTHDRSERSIVKEAESIWKPVRSVHRNSTTASTQSDLVLSKEQCRKLYGDRKFLSLEKRKLPPMLYTFPGSGNTWGRLLIEYATGIYTGSVYNDKSLLQALPGEFTCNWQVSAIKIHPHTHTFEHLRVGRFNSDAMKCKKGNVKRIERAILLIRNPFDSIWSEYQRRLTQSHVGGIKKRGFDWSRWQANAASLSNSYHQMWAVHHAGIERHFKPSDYIYIRYEDLRSKDARLKALRRITEFLDISDSDLTDQRLHCAFLLADNRQAHRQVDPSVTMTKHEAYTKPLVCRMWQLFGSFAEKHDYNVWANYNCSEGGPYPPIPKINVGPQGEYNRKWVKSGAQLLDFGGHPASEPLRPGETLDEGADKGPPMGGMRYRKKQNTGNSRVKVGGKRKPGTLQENQHNSAVESVAGGAPDPSSAEATWQAKSKRKRIRKPNAVSEGASNSLGMGGLGQGMSMEIATSKAVGAANVGLDKPAWQR